MINCALITDDETLRRHVRSLVRRPDTSDRLALELDHSASALPRDRVADILASKPHVVFVDLGNSVTGLRVLELLAQEAPEVVLIAAGPTLDADALLRVMRAGAAEYLPRPFDVDDIAQAYSRVRRRAGLNSQEESTASGQITTVFSPKGGVGVTTVAVNLAVVLVERTQQPTIVVDLASVLGTAALSIGLQPRYSYLDVIENFHRVDEELFRSFLEVHESGVHVLASPPVVKGQTGPSMDEVMGLLRFCRRHYANVVVDAGNSLTDAAEAALLEADHRLLVSTPELPTLRNLKRVLELLLDYSTNGKAPPKLVLNQYADSLGVTVTEVEKGLGLEVASVIERDSSLIAESINLGRPAVLMKKSAFDRAVNELADGIVRPSQNTVQRAGLLNTLLRPFRSNGSAATAKEVN